MQRREKLVSLASVKETGLLFVALWQQKDVIKPPLATGADMPAWLEQGVVGGNLGDDAVDNAVQRAIVALLVVESSSLYLFCH